MGMTTPSSERGPQTSRNVKLWFSMVSLIKARQQGRTLRKVDHCPTEEACAKVPRRILEQTWKAVARLMSPKKIGARSAVTAIVFHVGEQCCEIPRQLGTGPFALRLENVTGQVGGGLNHESSRRITAVIFAQFRRETCWTKADDVV